MSNKKLYADAAKRIVQKAERENRILTNDERARVEELIDAAKLADVIEKESAFPSGAVGDSQGPSIIGTWKARGGKVEPGQISRTMLTHDDRSTKALLTAGEVDDVLDREEPGIRRLAFVERWVYPAVPTAPLDGSTMTIEALVQDTRTLAHSSQVLMSFGSSNVKPTTASHVTLQRVDALMFATLSEFLPNAYWEREDLRAVVENDLRLALREALDVHVVGQLLANAQSATAGNNIIDKIVQARAKVEDNGFAPSFTALSPADAVSLQIIREGSNSGTYLLQNRPDLGTLRVSKRVSTGSLIAVSSEAGTLYMGGMALDLDGFTQFAQNHSRARAEFPARYIVKQPTAIAVAT